MPLQTTAQFPGITPDILGATQRGLVNRQVIQQEENKRRLLEQSQAQLGTRQRALGVPAQAPEAETPEAAKLRAIADDPALAGKLLSNIGIVDQTQKEEAAAFATNALAAQPEVRANLINDRVRAISARGGDPSDTLKLLDMPEAQLVSSLKGLEVSALTSMQRAVLPAKQETADLKRQALELRKEESRLRAIEQQQRTETNALKRQELDIKIEESKRKIGEAQRSRDFKARSALSEVDNSIGTIDRMLLGDGLEAAAGIEANLPTLSGTKAADFEGMLETLQSQAFLTQIEKMKGSGSLSENEGKKLAAAVGSLSLSMRDETLRAEINRIRTVMVNAKKSLRKKFNIKDEPLPEGDADILTPGEEAELQELQGRFPQ